MMIPERPRANTASYAELKLFEAFEKKLPRSYQVYHSVAWQARESQRGVQDGEADFLVMDPRGDMLVLEVKGGIVNYDHMKDEWTSNGNLIKNPFRQGRRAKYSLLGKFKEIFDDSIFFQIGNAVAFPDFEVEGSLGMDMPREIILDIKDIDDLSAKIESVYDYIFPPAVNRNPLDDTVRRKIEDLLSSSWSFSPPLTRYFANLNQIVDQLTEEQYQIIDFLQRHRKVAISGCAGSGKTLVAIEKAIRLDREGFSVLILCHNPYLARNIRLRTEGTKITTFSFTEFLRQVARTPGSSEVASIAVGFAVQDPWTQYEEPQPNDITHAMEGLSEGARKYDAIIVDEGQDFRQDWWEVVEASLIDPKNGILYIFFDDRQVISPFATETYPVPSAPFDLSRNCRNAGKIFKLVQKLHPSMPDPSKQLEKEGVVKQWVYSSEQDFLGNFKSAMLDAERYSPYFKDVIVITAELNHVYRSRLNGVVFDTPQIKNSTVLAPSGWRETVLDLLRGFDEGMLSNSPHPLENDIKRVSEYSQEWIRRRREWLHFRNQPYPLASSFKWSMDIYGNLKLLFEGKLLGRKDDWKITNFFANRDWARTLPYPYKRFRLTTADDMGKYPRYYLVQLADIPTFKGLESNGVVFVFYDHFSADEVSLVTNLYIAVSRAKYLLNIVTPFSLTDRIEAMYEKYFK